MGRVITIILLGVILGQGSPLDQACLSCHRSYQVPSELIYRRYLLQYSTPQAIEQMMIAYLQHPHQSTSIMPPQFFLKFPMKEATALDTLTLQHMVRAYIEKFDIKKRLILKQ